MFRLAYVSKATVPDPQLDDLAAIVAIADRNNRQAKITGGLLVSRSRFFQVLEGREKEVRATLSRIAADPRHHDVQVVLKAEAAGRLFDGWGMVAARVTPTNSVNIDRAIDEAVEYPHAAVTALLNLTHSQQR